MPQPSLGRALQHARLERACRGFQKAPGRHEGPPLTAGSRRVLPPLRSWAGAQMEVWTCESGMRMGFMVLSGLAGWGIEASVGC